MSITVCQSEQRIIKSQYKQCFMLSAMDVTCLNPRLISLFPYNQLKTKLAKVMLSEYPVVTLH